MNALLQRLTQPAMLIADGGTAAVMAQAIAKSYGATRGAFVVNDAARRTHRQRQPAPDGHG